MGKNYRGLFLFEEWLDALNHLAPKTAMTIINNLYRYDSEGVLPPPIRGSAGVLQNIMLAHGKRAHQAEVYGRMGAEARRKRAAEEASAKAAAEEEARMQEEANMQAEADFFDEMEGVYEP